MADIWYDVDTALAEVPINFHPLTDDTDFKSREESVTYNQAGLDLVWNFLTCAGAFTQTAVTPTDTGGNYDFVNQGNGIYTIEMPASGGASINNDTEGFGYFTGVATGILPWSSKVYGFRRAPLNDLFIEGSTASTNLEDFFDGTGYAGGTAKLTVDVSKVNGTAQTAGDLAALLTTIDDFLDTEIAAIVAAVITNAAGADVAADIIALQATIDALETSANVAAAVATELGTGSAFTTLASAADLAAAKAILDILKILRANKSIENEAGTTITYRNAGDTADAGTQSWTEATKTRGEYTAS